MFPRFGVSGMVTLGGNDHRYNAFMSYTAAASLTKVRGAHTLKGGFEGRMLRVNVWEARSAGTFNFRANETQGPNPNTASSTAGYGFASFLLGIGQPNDVLIQNWKNVASNSFYWGVLRAGRLARDSRLTLNLGLRYDIDVPRTERFDRMNYFDPDAPSPLAQQVPAFPDLRGGVVFVGVDGNSRYQYNWDTNNIAPRLGASYQVNDKTVVRAGYSHIFGPSNQGAQGTVGPFGFRTENLWVTTIDGITPFNTLQNPYPNGFLPSPGSSQGLLTQAGANLQAPLQDTPSPWTIQYNVNVQRELPWGTVRRGGLRRHARLRPVDRGRRRSEPEPARSAVHGARIAAQSAGAEPLLRDRQQRRADAADGQPRATAAALSAVHRHRAALCVRREVALQRAADHRAQAPVARAHVRGVVHLRESRGDRHEPSEQLRHRGELGAGVVRHQPPLRDELSLRAAGRTRSGGSSPTRRPSVNAIIGGWQFNGITTFQAGTPLSITANNTAGLFGARTQPNNTGADPRLDGPVEERLDRYFDTSVYSQPAAFTFGNEPIFSPMLRAHGVRNVDLSLFKNFESPRA